MANGPAPFYEIGKKVKDLLTKDYNFDKKFTLIRLSEAGLGLTATGVNKDHLFLGDICTHYRSGKTTVLVKVDTSSNVSTTVLVNELIAGTKTSFSFNIPEQKSSKLDVQHLNKYAAINTSVGLTTTPSLEFAAAIGSKEFSIGAEFGFDTASLSLTKYNAAIGYNKLDLSAALILADKGEILKASYIHVLDPSKGITVGAEMVHRFDTFENSFTIGSSHYLDPLTMVKTRFSSTGTAAIHCQHQWRPKSFVTFSAEYDSKAVRSPSKVGLGLALKP